MMLSQELKNTRPHRIEMDRGAFSTYTLVSVATLSTLTAQTTSPGKRTFEAQCPPRRRHMVPIEVTVETTDGRKLHCLSVNRTFEDMQLRTSSGKIHLLRKEGARYWTVTSQADWPSYDAN